MTWKTHPLTRKASAFAKRCIGHGAEALPWKEILRRVLRRLMRHAKGFPGVLPVARWLRARFPGLWQRTAGRVLSAASDRQPSEYAGQFDFSGRSHTIPIASLLAVASAEPVDPGFLSMNGTPDDTQALLDAIQRELDAVLPGR